MGTRNFPPRGNGDEEPFPDGEIPVAIPTIILVWVHSWVCCNTRVVTVPIYTIVQHILRMQKVNKGKHVFGEVVPGYHINTPPLWIG
jgi:hypothetical protein